MAEGEQDTSIKKKVVAGAALGVVVPAAVAVARRLSGSDESKRQDAAMEEAGSRAKESTSGAARRARQNTGSTRARKATSTASKKTERTNEQLYREAKRLNISGRSKMSKAQLGRAVRRARS
jgi:hypothetical protein